MSRWLRLVGTIFALGLLFAACSDDGGEDSSSGGDAPADDGDAGGGCEADVCLEGSTFAPDAVTVAAGDTVTWQNADSIDHTVTADDGAFDQDLAGGDTYEETFDEAGEFAYHCEIHPSMTGTITVS